MMDEKFEKLIKWLRLREEFSTLDDDRKFPVGQLAADIWHSSLLRRILEGGPVFAFAPPLSYSYPDIGLIENGEIVNCDGFKPDIPGKFVINQSLWNIEEEISEDEYILSYDGVPGKFKATKGPVTFKRVDGTDGATKMLWKVVWLNPELKEYIKL